MENFNKKIINIDMGPKTNNKGFTLMEVIISVAVVITALVASITLISFSISSTTLNKSKLIAANLAQGGLEIVRNVRDTAWFNGYTGPWQGAPSWKEGLGIQSYNRVEYDQFSLLGPGDSRLYIDVNGFYSHDNTGAPSLFSRIIIIENVPGDDNQLKVTCEVRWQEKGRDRIIIAETRLYNWYGATP